MKPKCPVCENKCENVFPVYCKSCDVTVFMSRKRYELITLIPKVVHQYKIVDDYYIIDNFYPLPMEYD